MNSEAKSKSLPNHKVLGLQTPTRISLPFLSVKVSNLTALELPDTVRWENKISLSLLLKVKKNILCNGKFWHQQPLSETVNLLKAGQPTESSSSKTKHVGGDIPGPGSCSSPVCGKAERTKKDKAWYLLYICFCSPLHFHFKLVTFSLSHLNTVIQASYSSLQPGFQSIPLVMSSWGLCSVTFKQHHIPQGCWGQFTLIASLWWNALHLQSPKLLSACTKCRQISHPPHLPLQRRERPKPVVPTVNVMTMNDLRTLRILLKALSLAGNPYQHRMLLAENTQ